MFYSHLRVLSNWNIFRYEDVIFEKTTWTAALARCLDLDVSEEDSAAIAAKFDVFPSEENPNKHIRQVTPGNYKQHLTNEAVSYIESRCYEFRKMFNYM